MMPSKVSWTTKVIFWIVPKRGIMPRHADRLLEIFAKMITGYIVRTCGKIMPSIYHRNICCNINLIPIYHFG